jgi:hypothetical protein
MLEVHSVINMVAIVVSVVVVAVMDIRMKRQY